MASVEAPSLTTTATALAHIFAFLLPLRDLFVESFSGPGSYSWIIATLFVLGNLKNVPFAWHFRVWNAVLSHCLFSKPSIPPNLAPSSLFLPVITESYVPCLESDFNLHKSNSTYFSDLDVTRLHIVCTLLEPGIAALRNNSRNKIVFDRAGIPVKGPWSIVLGGVMCTFKREIGMYRGYEMWSRVLCWDRKWIYIVTHFVEKGAVKPKAYVLTDGSWFRKKGNRSVKRRQGEREAKEVDEKAILASAISKYVVKLGRLTIHPEVSLNASGLLPPKPGGWATMMGDSKEPSSETIGGQSMPETLEVENEKFEVKGDGWDWRRIEAENKKGLKYAEHFGALDGLHGEFTGSQQAALGKYRDFLM